MRRPVMNLILCCLLLSICSRGTAQSSVEPRPPKQTFIYKTVGNTAIKADVYRLAGDDPRPVIVWFHPGGLIMGSREMLPADERERFRDTGFVVVAIDYRLAPETKLPEILKDVEDAHRWVREEGPRLFQVDPNRIAAVGRVCRWVLGSDGRGTRAPCVASSGLVLWVWRYRGGVVQSPEPLLP